MLRCSQQGFTLLEIMVVVLLMGLMAATVTLSFNTSTPEQKLEKKAKQFMATTELVINETILSGQFLGIVIEPDGYHYVVYHDSQWQPLTNDRILTERKLDDGMSLSVVVDGLPLKQSDEDRSDDIFENDDDKFNIDESVQPKKKLPTPQIMLFPSGELSPFELTFAMRDQQGNEHDQLVAGDALGRLTLGRPDDQP
ncbi:type II secretion system protein GspH [Parashewanella curva]|uniref:Type II secretion system protein H n=1 Tax=Parashewanella curva TaxID=2338552 RepID=A0A3L8PZJ8_9GAMM|nr:type II secretion system minor pseudopilin GspH [Parashewanella curva]RLV60781.1 type II secretion system protein GspH [Parashewanella curva]